MKPSYGKKAKLCYRDTDSFIVHVKSENIYPDLAGDVRILTNSTIKSKDHYPQEKPKYIELMKEELGGKIMKKVVALRPKMYSCLTDNGCVNKKANGINKCIIKYKIKFKDYKKCLESNKAKLRLQKGSGGSYTMYSRKKSTP